MPLETLAYWGEVAVGDYRAMDSVILAQTGGEVAELSAVSLAMTDLLVVDDGLLDSHLDYYGEQQ